MTAATASSQKPPPPRSRPYPWIQMEDLADALLDFQSPADLSAWLAATT